MTFLNPLALFGLLAAAVPILLHLLNLRKLRTVEFSTLAFLKELQKTSIRRLKLRQILLLILRTFLILLIVLAFARPTMRGSFIGSPGSQARTSAVFLLDDSYSMSTSDEQGELLRQAKQAARNAESLFLDGDEIFFLRLSTVSRGTTDDDHATTDFGLLRREIDDTKLSAVRRPLKDGLRRAARLLAGTSNFNKEVYLFSDFQQGVMDNGPSAEGVTAGDSLFPPDIRCFLVPLGVRPPQNFSVESVTIPTSIFEQGKPFIVQATIGNHSDAPVQDHVVSVFLHGQRVAQRSIDLAKGASVPVEFPVSADTVGQVEGFVELEDDDFQEDNRRSFVVQIPERTRVLLAGTSRDLQYPQLALSTRTSASESVIDLTTVTPENLSSNEIKRADVIVLCTSTGFSNAQLAELSSYEKNGGGIILFPGAQTDPATFNARFTASLGAPTLSGIDRSASSGGSSFVEFDRVELQHPIFNGMFETPASRSAERPGSTSATAKKDIESPRILSSAHFALSRKSNPIITMTNGAPFLTEQETGAGKLFLFAVPPTTEWSDFPLKGLFVPLLHRSVLYLARQQGRTQEIAPGDEIVLRGRGPAGASWTIQNPDRVEVTAAPVVQAFQQLLRFDGTEVPGIYSVSAGQVSIGKFVVNLDPRESRTENSSPAERESLLRNLGISPGAVHEVSHPDDLSRVVLQSRFGVELWKYCILLAIIVAIIELFVARSTKRDTIQVPDHD